VDKEATPVPGDLLIAAPELRDPNFRRSVVFICSHSDEEGTFGLILNRPLSAKVCDLPLSEPLSSDAFLSIGGPVQTNTLHYLHCHDHLVERSISVIRRLCWGGEIEDVRLLLERNDATPEKLRFFLGYSGWAPGQLSEEISQGGWILSESYDDLIFSHEPKGLWRTVLSRMGGEYALLVNYPDDLRLN